MKTKRVSAQTARAYDLVLNAQAVSNRNVERFAADYASHREHLMAAIAQLTPVREARIALLGAGGCLDVDLGALGARFLELHLVDLDAQAISKARNRVSSSLQPHIARHAPVDLSGLLHAIDRWRLQPPTPALVEAESTAAVQRIVGALPGDFDVVVSCCLLTQLLRGVTSGLGESHPLLGEVLRRVILVHLRSMAALLAAGGVALLVSDFVANDSYPLESVGAEADLSALLDELHAAGNFFSGTDPNSLSRLLRRDKLLAASVTPPLRRAPWLWRAGPERLFLVYTLEFTRSAAEAAPPSHATREPG